MVDRQITELVATIEEQDRTIAENEAKIHELNATIDALGDELEVQRVKYRDVRQQHQELDSRLAQVNANWRDRHRAQQVHDRNRDAKDRLEAEKHKATDKEREIRQLEAGIHQLQLEYDQERQARVDLARKLHQLCNDLSLYLQKRAQDGMAERDEPLSLLQRLKELETERERDYHASQRQLREARAVARIKAEKVAEMQNHHSPNGPNNHNNHGSGSGSGSSTAASDSLLGSGGGHHAEDHLGLAAAAKDSEIAKFQSEIADERQRIILEIQELQRANEEQAATLKRNATDKSNLLGAQLLRKLTGNNNNSGTNHDEASPSALIPLEGKSPAQRQLELKNRELADERRQLKEQIDKLAAERTEFIKSCKQERSKTEKEKKSYEQELSRLDREYGREKKEQERLREEARRLQEQCDELAAIIQAARPSPSSYHHHQSQSQRGPAASPHHHQPHPHSPAATATGRSAILRSGLTNNTIRSESAASNNSTSSSAVVGVGVGVAGLGAAPGAAARERLPYDDDEEEEVYLDSESEQL